MAHNNKLTSTTLILDLHGHPPQPTYNLYKRGSSIIGYFFYKRENRPDKTSTYQSLEVSWCLLIKFVIGSWSFTLRSTFSPLRILSVITQYTCLVIYKHKRMLIMNSDYLSSLSDQAYWVSSLLATRPGKAIPPLGVLGI